MISQFLGGANEDERETGRRQDGQLARSSSVSSRSSHSPRHSNSSTQALEGVQNEHGLETLELTLDVVVHQLEQHARSVCDSDHKLTKEQFLAT